MAGFPLFFKLDEAKVLVAGAGEVAARKISALLDCGAQVTVIAPEVSDRVKELSAAHPGRVCLINGPFSEELLSGMSLAVAATADPAVNAAVSEAAQKRGIPVNAVDRPELCTFYCGAQVKRGPLTLAIGTDGTAPLLAKKLRRWLEEQLPENLGLKIETLGARRQKILAAGQSPAENAAYLKQLDGILALLGNHHEDT